jgi:transcriptional regulator with XRE-family HTH domain
MKPLNLPDAVPQTLGEQIAFLRIRAHLSQAKLAARAGISRQGLNLIERGQAIPSSPILVQKIYNGLGIEVDTDTVLNVLADEARERFIRKARG